MAIITLNITAPNEKIRAIATTSNGNESGADNIARMISHIADTFFLVEVEVASKSFIA